MKFIAGLLIVAAVLAVAIAVPHHKEGHEGTSCDYKCSEPKQGETICASNGSCLKTFPDECQLETYNCEEHPAKQFDLVDDKMCSQKSLPLCSA